MIKYLHSLAGRLTLWYAGIFSLCFLVVFSTFYVLARNHFERWTDTELTGEMREVRAAYDRNGLAGVIQQLKQEQTSEGERFVGRIVDKEGAVIFETAPGPWTAGHVNDKLALEARSGHESIELLELGKDRAVRVTYSLLPDGYLVQIGLALFEHEIWMRQFAHDLWKVALLALILSVSAGGFMAGRALAPLRSIARTASSISGRSLEQRVSISGRGDEIDQLAEAFNGMLTRIDTLVEGLRDVTDTLAHDLRTPMTGIRGIVEVTLRSQRAPDTYRMTLYRILEQIDRLLTLFNSILDAAEAESGTLTLRHETVQMEKLAEEVLQTFAPVAVDKSIKIESSIAPGLKLEGDRERLIQALVNLMDNAIKYTPSGGRVRLSVHSDPEPNGIIITVADTGPGIPQKDLPHIFERYYRGDSSRSGPGIGLGLPLVQGIVRSHGGSVTVESRPEQGTVFRVFLPFTANPEKNSDL